MEEGMVTVVAVGVPIGEVVRVPSASPAPPPSVGGEILCSAVDESLTSLGFPELSDIPEMWVAGAPEDLLVLGGAVDTSLASLDFPELPDICESGTAAGRVDTGFDSLAMVAQEMESNGQSAEPARTTAPGSSRRSDPGAFERQYSVGDSDQCRRIFEQILQDRLGREALRPYRAKAKHLSVGACRHVAITHEVPLPPESLLSNASFCVNEVPQHLWLVPTDCRRIAKGVEMEGRCGGDRCVRCSKLEQREPASL